MRLPCVAQLWPHKFQNKTNGVTQRRWLAFCNPPLRKLVTAKLGSDEWIKDLYKLQVRLCGGVGVRARLPRAKSG